MGRPKPSAANADRPRPSKELRALRKGLDLDEADWHAFLWHARNGFADLEKAEGMGYEQALRLDEAPAEWFRDQVALGYVTVRVLREGKASLAAPVARYFLRLCDFGPRPLLLPPGIGLAWVRLDTLGLDAPVDPARLAHLALDVPRDFFQGVSEDELPRLSRLILESRGSIEAWDVHALIAAVDRARIHVRAPFRLFHVLMGEDWITSDVKREFCRGLLACDPEARRLREHAKALRQSIHDDPESMSRIPLIWLELHEAGVFRMAPGLQRHAVQALVEDLGEPIPAVISEFFLRKYHDQRSTEFVAQGVLDLIRHHAGELGSDAVRQFLRRAIKDGSAVARQAAYRIGAEQFGQDFARPALKDSARLVRDWAGKLLARDTGEPSRKAGPRQRPSSSTGE
jgi:hypothetical protein